MKVLEIVLSLVPGGAERFVVDLSNEMAARGVNVTLLTLKNDKSGRCGFLLPSLAREVRHICAGFFDGFKFSYLWRVMRIIREEAPDVVHFHGAARRYVILANLFLGRKIRFFQTIHNDVLLGYSDALSRALILSSAWIGKTSFVTISTTNSQQFAKVYPHCHQTMIVNGRASSGLSGKINEVRRLMESYGSKPVLLHVARFDAQKNQKLLAKAFSLLGDAATLVVLGDGFGSTDGMEIQAIAGPRAHFLGPVDNVEDYMACADLFCLCSSYEGMPITLLEAAMCGLPVVSTPVSGAVDIVGENGVICEDFEVRTYYEALRDALGRLPQLKAAAREMAADFPYTMGRCAAAYIELFEDGIH